MNLSGRTAAIAGVGAIVVVVAGVWGYRASTTRPPGATVREPFFSTVSAAGDPLRGAFEYRVPCGDCFALKLSLILYHNADTKAPSTYLMSRVHVGKGDDRTVNEGRWSIERGIQGYPDAVVYRLDATAPAEFKSFWAINENLLLVLDQYGNPRVGTGGVGFLLNRTY